MPTAVATKRCSGPLHRQGVMLPLGKFAKLSNGKPLSQCRDCRNHYQGRDEGNTWVPVGTVQPILNVLAPKFGGITHLAVALGLQRNYFSRRHRAVKRRTFDKMVKIMDEIRDPAIKPVKSGEALVSQETEKFSRMMKEWIKKYNAQHHPNAEAGDYEQDQLGPQQCLSERSGVNVRQISGLLNNEFPSISLTKLDQLLLAMGMQDELHRFKLIPNPNWKIQWWVEHMEQQGGFDNPKS